MAARGDNHLSRALAQHPLVFALNYCRTERCFLRVGKTELPQRLSQRLDANALKICFERRRNTGNNRPVTAKQNIRKFGLVDNLLGVLRTDNKASATQYTFVGNYMRLIA
jgi:hypothetical protein